MHFKMEADYAIRMVDYLVKSNKLARAPEIAAEAKVPLRFAKSILQKLAKEKIVNSYLGVNGGYKLGRQTEEISMYDIIEAISGPIELSQCVATSKECPCKSDTGCRYHKVFMEMSAEMENRLREVRFSTNSSI